MLVQQPIAAIRLGSSVVHITENLSPSKDYSFKSIINVGYVAYQKQTLKHLLLFVYLVILCVLTTNAN